MIVLFENGYLHALSWIMVGMIYFVPTVVAMARNHPARVSILLLDIFLGWTLLGWVAALV